MVKTNEVDFDFPVLGFTPDIEVWGFPNLDTLTKCGPQTIRENLQSGMELVDSAGRSWIVRSVVPIGYADGALKRLMDRLIYGHVQTRIEHELEPIGMRSLAEVQAMACAVVVAHPTDYTDAYDEGALESLLAPLKAAASITELYDALGLDTFEAY